MLDGLQYKHADQLEDQTVLDPDWITLLDKNFGWLLRLDHTHWWLGAITEIVIRGLM